VSTTSAGRTSSRLAAATPTSSLGAAGAGASASPGWAYSEGDGQNHHRGEVVWGWSFRRLLRGRRRRWSLRSRGWRPRGFHGSVDQPAAVPVGHFDFCGGGGGGGAAARAGRLAA
jgi:hypothetical protein